MTHRIAIPRKIISSAKNLEAIFFDKVPDPSTSAKAIERNNLKTISTSSFSEIHIEMAPQHGPT